MRKIIGIVIYYAIAKRLPASTSFFLGKSWKRLRNFCGKMMLYHCGKNINIEKNAVFSTSVSLGDNSGIGINANIAGAVKIGDNVMMGPNCTIYSRNHAFDDINIPMIQQGYSEEKPVIIEDDVWIGGNVTILPGVTIKTGSIIGACSVVTKDVEAYSIVAGNPAKVVKIRQ